MADLMVPAHVYQPQLGSGIEWTPERVRLWMGGAVWLEARNTTAAAWDFWYELRMVEAFPDVTHWWFRDAWTGQVRISRPQSLQDATTIYGWMQFIDQAVPAVAWTLSEREPLIVGTPMPPNALQPVNLPLRLGLARYVLAVLNDELVADEWYLISSLVRRDELAAAFPTTLDALRVVLPRPLTRLVTPAAVDLGGERTWRLDLVEAPLREALCRLQGLMPPG